MPQNGVRWRSSPCCEPAFLGTPALDATRGSWAVQADPPVLQARGSLAALIAFLFSLGLKNVQSSLEVSPQQEPRVTPRAGPSLGTGSRGMGGGTLPGSPAPDQSAQQAVL